MNIIGTSS